jgi:hypothetical protein
MWPLFAIIRPNVNNRHPLLGADADLYPPRDAP